MTWLRENPGKPVCGQTTGYPQHEMCKKPFLPNRLYLSHNRPASIPVFYSFFQAGQVLDPVEKMLVIHKKIGVYYYYQNIYIQVNLKQ
jgi:hypothetical protein